MSEPQVFRRSAELMSAGDTALLVVDAQQKLLERVPRAAELVWNVGRLLDGAAALDMLRVASEQYPERLGPTQADLAARLERPAAKRAFSCLACGAVAEALERSGVSRVLVAGIETHVCVQQTALDLISDGYRVYVAADAVAARHQLDHDVALARIQASGAVVTTTEAALFEWCESSLHPRFKQISALVKRQPPG